MRIKKIFAIGIVAITVMCFLAITVSANNYSSSGTFSASGGTNSYSNTGSASTCLLQVQSSKIYVDYMINGVRSRYVNAYIEKDNSSGAMIAYKSLGGTLSASTRKTGNMSRSSSDASGTVYESGVIVYNNTSSYSGIADSYFYYAHIS